MNRNYMEQRILEAISRHAEELTEAQVVIDRAFFRDLAKALTEAYMAQGRDGLDLGLLHSTLNRLQTAWSLSEQGPDNRGSLPTAV